VRTSVSVRRPRGGWLIAALPLLVVAPTLATVGCAAREAQESRAGSARIVGAKIYEADGDLEHLFASFDDLGINTLFVSEALASAKRFRDLARAHHMPVFVIFPVFYDPEALKEDPSLYAVTRSGECARDDWVEFVCPTRKEFRRRKVEALRNLVAAVRPDGVSLDFIRFFVYWEMIHPDRSTASLPNTCFCPSCLAQFAAATGIAIPPSVRTPQQAAEWIETTNFDRWVDWKCQVISSMVEELVRAARSVRPGVMVNIHAVPWRRDDFGGAIKSVAGQDLGALSRFADYVSPMCYTLMLRRPPGWVASVIAEMSTQSSCPILPSIQVRPAYPGDLAMSTHDFTETLDAALAPPSHGVVFWSWKHLAQEPEKMRVIAARLGPRRGRLGPADGTVHDHPVGDMPGEP
jgi:hypothetical protein